MRTFLLVAALTATSLVGTAVAAGGKNIGEAPSVTPGTQHFGNTAADGGQHPGSVGNCSGGGDSWWNVSLEAGDVLTVDWEAPAEHFLYVFPLGTDDFNVNDTYPAAEDEIGGNGKSRLRFKASQTGTYPIDFSEGSCFGDSMAGPYNFTSYVAHGMALLMPRLDSLDRDGTVHVGVRTPEGAPIASGVNVAIQQKRRRGWREVGAASTEAGSAAVPVSIPARFKDRRVRLRARGSGPGYLTETSRIRRIKIN